MHLTPDGCSAVVEWQTECDPSGEPTLVGEMRLLDHLRIGYLVNVN